MNYDIIWSFIKKYVLHNFTKYFSGAWVNQIVNKNLVNHLALAIFRKWMMLETINKNAFEIMTLPNNLVLICRFEDHNLMFCSLYMVCNICFLLKHGSQKTSARVVKYESQVVKSNPVWHLVLWNVKLHGEMLRQMVQTK